MLKGYNFAKMLVIAFAVLACVGMWGCGWDESVDDVSIRHLVGYSGDSLVVYIEEKKEETCLAKPLGDDCSTRKKGTRVVVDNFFTKENIWKSGKIDDENVVDVYDLIDDSTMIAFSKTEGTFYKWILGKEREKLGSFGRTGCGMNQSVEEIRPWGDGKLRLVGGNAECAYAIVDVKKKEITGYENLDEFAKDCSDLWMHEGLKYCVELISKKYIRSQYIYGIYLRSEGFVQDSLWLSEENGFGVCTHLLKISYEGSFLKLSDFCYENGLVAIDYSRIENNLSNNVIWLRGLFKE